MKYNALIYSLGIAVKIKLVIYLTAIRIGSSLSHRPGACALCPQVLFACSLSVTCTGAAPGAAASVAWPPSVVMQAPRPMASASVCPLGALEGGDTVAWPVGCPRKERFLLVTMR